MRTQEKLVQICGERFLQYILAIEDRASLEGIELNQNQRDILGYLDSQLTALSEEQASGVDAHSSLAGLSTYDPGAGTSLVNLLRQMVAGHDSLPSLTPTNDPVLAPLQRLTRDIWPIYLLPVPKVTPHPFWLLAPIGLYQHPVTLELANSILNDNQLAKLFPKRSQKIDMATSLDDVFKHNGMIFSTVGHGGGIQVITVISTMISDTILRSLIGHENLDWTIIKENMQESLSALRVLTEGKAVGLPMVIGLNGLTFPQEFSLTIAGGTLRHPTEMERTLLLPNAEHTSIVFETTFPTRLFIDEAPDDSDERPLGKLWPKILPQVEEAQRSFQFSMNILRLALLLASSTAEPLLMNEVSRFITEPLQLGGTRSWNPVSFTATSHELKDEIVDDLREWYELIKHKHQHTLDVGLRRLLAATTTRTDALDAFVDAVIAWENMFGTRTETTFRVTGSIVKLIGPQDAAERQELQTELKELYQKRSALVHGGKEPPTRKIWEYRTRAIEIAVECFRRMYRDRPDLLALESEARSTRLLLE